MSGIGSMMLPTHQGLIHLDVTKLVAIPPDGGCRVLPGRPWSIRVSFDASPVQLCPLCRWPLG